MTLTRIGTSWRQGLGGGIVAGFIAGAVLIALIAFVSVAESRDVWTTLKFAGTPLLGERAARPGFDGGAVLIGLLCHFAIAIGWAALFGLLVHGLRRDLTVLLGPLYGIVVWLVMYYAVLPIVGMAEVARAAPIGQAMFEHMLFGFLIAIGLLPFQRLGPRMHHPHRPAGVER
jgi:hypothetical protein